MSVNPFILIFTQAKTIVNSFVGIFVFFIVLLIKKRKRESVTALKGNLKLSLTFPTLFYFLAK